MNKKALSIMTVTSLTWWGSCHAELLGCLIEPDRVADVGSQSTGVLEKITVERGDNVAAGQVLARLGAQVERASASVAEVRSRAEAETLQAQAAYELAQRKLERTRDLVRRDFVSDQALDQAEAEARVALQRIEQARETQRVAQRELQLSNAQLSQREVRSPFAGLVVERYRTEGERIEREPVVRVARIDPLRVEAIVPAAQFGTIKAGQLATLKTELPEHAVLNAQVTLVDRVVDPASNSFRVRLSLPNPGNRIPSGLRCRIAFDSSALPAGRAPAAAVPPPASAGQVAPARWVRPPEAVPAAAGPLPAARPVAVVFSAPAHTPRRVEAPAQPERFVSSTLKFAMAELGRSSPGNKLLPPPLAGGQVRGRSVGFRPKALAMAKQLPTLLSPTAAVATQVVAARAPLGARPDDRHVSVSGLHLASVP